MSNLKTASLEFTNEESMDLSVSRVKFPRILLAVYNRDALWTFVDVPGVEPTNNHAERELRAFVMWRRRSFGSQSERGCRFAERIMTVTHTLRKQKRHVLTYLTDACQAALRGKPAPSLVIANP